MYLLACCLILLPSHTAIKLCKHEKLFSYSSESQTNGGHSINSYHLNLWMVTQTMSEISTDRRQSNSIFLFLNWNLSSTSYIFCYKQPNQGWTLELDLDWSLTFCFLIFFFFFWFLWQFLKGNGLSLVSTTPHIHIKHLRSFIPSIQVHHRHQTKKFWLRQKEKEANNFLQRNFWELRFSNMKEDY